MLPSTPPQTYNAHATHTHRRADLLQKELAWMAANREAAREVVGSKIDYWSL
jgi:hypothetical protein